MHPWVVSVDALVATGWRPQRSNRDALAELVADHADDLVLGRVRTTRTRARQVGGAVVAVAVVGGVLGRRRRASPSPPDRLTGSHRTSPCPSVGGG